MQFFTGISLFLSKVSPAWNRWRVDEHWKKKTRLYVDNQWSLSEDQKGNIDAFWGRYCKVDDLFHRFYSQKTGVFDVRYIPDHVYYNIIDKFYNPEQLAKNLDDKSLYESILVDREGVIKHPETIAIKSGGYWLTHKFEPISEPEVMKRIKDSQEVFVKASVDSCGGKGVQYLNTADESGNSILNILKMGGG